VSNIGSHRFVTVSGSASQRWPLIAKISAASVWKSTEGVLTRLTMFPWDLKIHFANLCRSGDDKQDFDSVVHARPENFTP
jgi:hypothetical protein